MSNPSERSGLPIQEVYAQMRALAGLLLHIPVADVEAVVNELRFVDAAMPIVDPTGYRNIMRTKPGHDKLAHAFLRFRRELEELLDEAPE